MSIKQYLKKNWKDFFKEEAPDDFDCVLLSSCLEEYGNDLILIFLDRLHYPKYIMKMCRTPEYGFKIEREYNGLLHLSKNAFLRKYIPYPYKIGTFNGSSFVIQGGIMGKSLHEILRHKGYTSYTKKLINQSIDLLVKINLANIISETGCDITSVNVIDTLRKQNDFIRQAGLSYSDLEPFLEQNDEVDGGRYFFTHGDFWGANILINPSSNEVSGIIDWEFSNTCSKNPMDIIWFILNILFAINTKKSAYSSFSSIIIHSLSIPGSLDLIRDCFKRYANQIGIKDLNCGKLLICTLIEMSFREILTYGKSNKMDKECLSLLRFFIADKHIIPAVNSHENYRLTDKNKKQALKRG